MQAVCPDCGTLNPLTNKFCSECGSSLEAAKVVKDTPKTTGVETAIDKKKGTRWGCIILVVIIGIIGTIWILAQAGGNDRDKKDSRAVYVTLDGYDKDADVTIYDINVWKDYDDRAAGIVGTGNHGEQVKFIKQVGDGVLIELPNGKQGWVTYYFIKEYK